MAQRALSLAITVLIVVLLVILILRLTGHSTRFGVEDASAHPLPKGSTLPGLHRICSTIGVCRDQVPRPTGPCQHSNDGQQKQLYDPYLDTFVTWECHCPIFYDERECHWRRINLTHHWTIAPVTDVHRRYVRDRMRRCASIVCKGEWVRHYWPTLYALDGNL